MKSKTFLADNGCELTPINSGGTYEAIKFHHKEDPSLTIQLTHNELNTWSVSYGCNVINKDVEPEWEPSPSNRCHQ